jgi:hypothetical protein
MDTKIIKSANKPITTANTTTTTPTKSVRRVAREAKLLKQQANQRTYEERQIEVNKIFDKLSELGIPDIMLGNFPKITKDFVEHGISASGIIKIPDIERELVYLFSNNRRHQCGSMLHDISNV